MQTRPLVALIEMLTVLTPSVNVVKISQILMEHAQQVKCSTLYNTIIETGNSC